MTGAMTVAALTELLKQFSPDVYVVVDGYEGDYDNPDVREAVVAWDANTEEDSHKSVGYYGRHREIDDDSILFERPNRRRVLVIGRET